MIDGGKRNPSDDFIKLICNLYGDTYDDREEDSRPGGEDWEPGVKAEASSLVAATAAMGMPPPIALAMDTPSGFTP